GCLDELLKRAGLDNQEVKVQTVGRSFFLLIENQGPRVDGAELVSAGRIIGRVPALDTGVNVAVCMGFDGRSGYNSREYKLSEVRLTGGRSQETVLVHDPLMSPGYGVSDCGNYTYSYPQLPK